MRTEPFWVHNLHWWTLKAHEIALLLGGLDTFVDQNQTHPGLVNPYLFNIVEGGKGWSPFRGLIFFPCFAHFVHFSVFRHPKTRGRHHWFSISSTTRVTYRKDCMRHSSMSNSQSKADDAPRTTTRNQVSFASPNATAPITSTISDGGEVCGNSSASSPNSMSDRVNTRNALATHIEINRDEISAENVSNATNVALLRYRERDLHATCHRLFWCLHPEYKADFAYESKEGTGCEVLRTRNLHFSKFLSLNRTNELRQKYEADADAKRRLKRGKRANGSFVKTQKVISRAVTAEIAPRQNEIKAVVKSASRINHESNSFS